MITHEDARRMGAKGSPANEEERALFEAWMRGHCWELAAVWDGVCYRGSAEHGHYVCPHAMQTRVMWAAWRDRAALARQDVTGEACAAVAKHALVAGGEITVTSHGKPAYRITVEKLECAE